MQTQLTFGFHDIELSSIHVITDPASETSYLQVFGKHFTEYSDIYINGTRYKATVPVSDTELFLADVSLSDGDVISVAMPIDDTTVLRESAPFVYHEDAAGR